MWYSQIIYLIITIVIVIISSGFYAFESMTLIAITN